VLPEPHAFDRWLTCTTEEARETILLDSVDLFEAGPVDDGAAPSEAEFEEEV